MPANIIAKNPYCSKRPSSFSDGLILKIARAFIPKYAPNWWPITPPSTEPIMTSKPKNKAWSFFNIARGINKTSGGIGKKKDSATAIINNNHTAKSLSAACSISKVNYSIILFLGWGPRIRTPTYWSRISCPTIRRVPKSVHNIFHVIIIISLTFEQQYVTCE